MVRKRAKKISKGLVFKAVGRKISRWANEKKRPKNSTINPLPRGRRGEVGRATKKKRKTICYICAMYENPGGHAPLFCRRTCS